MKKIVFFSILLLGMSLNAQVGVDTDSPHPSAMLHLESVEKGFLPPRVTLQSIIDVTTIDKPAEGLVVYNLGTDNVCLFPGLHFYNGDVWRSLDSDQISGGVLPGNTPVANVVRDPAPGYGGFTGSTPPEGMTVVDINSNVGANNPTTSLFNGNLADPSNTFTVFRDTTTEDWGSGYIFDKNIRFTQVDLNGRSTTEVNFRDRIVGVVVQVVRCGEVIWESSPLTSSSVNSNIVSIPNIVGNEIRIVIPDGNTTGSPEPNPLVINYDELIISGEM